MKSIKGTLTEENLLKAFAGESQARNRYTIFAEAAKREGYEQIAGVFLETAEQELAHAKLFFGFLEGGSATINGAAYPAGAVRATADNLLAAAEGEKEEWGILYPTFADTAMKEGFLEVAAAFKMISSVEVEHEKRYLKLLERLNGGSFFHRDGAIWWQCRNCGYVCKATDAPLICPSCRYPQSYFEPKPENY